jgi:serine protease Do
LAQGLNIPPIEGVIVSDVDPEGTAARAGLKIQDVIVSMDGSPVTSMPVFNVNLYLNDTAHFVKLGVIRAGTKVELNVPVFETVHDPESLAEIADPTKDLIPRLGIVGVTVNSQVETLLGALRIEGGVAVASLVSDQLAVDSGLNVGDVIHALKGAPITSVSNLREAFNALKPGESATLQVERAGRLIYLTFDME